MSLKRLERWKVHPDLAASLQAAHDSAPIDREAVKVGLTRRKISALHLLALVWNFFRASQIKDMGFNDCDYTYEEFLREIGHKRVEITDDMLERLLYCGNMLDEKKKFEHPLGMSFDGFLKRVLTGREEYNKMLGVIEEKKDDRSIRR